MTDGAGGFFDGLDDARAEAERAAPAPRAAAWELLADLTDLLNSPLDRFEQVVSAALDAMIGISRADRGLLMLKSESSGGLEVRLARNIALDDLPADERRVSQSILDDVVRSGQGVAIPDLGTTTRFAESASVAELKLLSVLCVPLVQRLARRRPEGDEQRTGERRPGDKVIGAIYVDSRSVTTSFREDDLPLFQAVANVVTTAIVRADDFRRATTDALTGLASRPYLERRLADEVELTRLAEDSDLSALLIDIDHLGDVNLNRGYAAGDRVIQTVGRVLRRRTRLHDTAGRYGGEEFCVTLPETDAEGAEEVARKLLVSLQREGVQVSIGVATYRRGESGADLVRRCDQALSQAKVDGGGRARPYTANLAQVAPATDKLAGIFTGEPAAVYRNVLMLLESIPKIHQAGSVERVLEGVLETVIDLARAERGYLVFEERPGDARARLALDWRRRQLPDAGFDRRLAANVIQSGEAVGGTGGVLCVPIAARGESQRGAIYLEARELGFREGAVAFVSAFARQGGIAIENAKLLEENRTYARKTEKLMRALEDEREQIKKERELEDESQLAASDPNGAPPSTEASEGSAPARATPRPPAAREIGRYGKIIGNSEPMQKVFRRLDRVTQSTVPVFIHGESGTGKELIAKAVHFNGPRRKGRFVAENCAAMSETLLESELFGYVKGAFTGAHADRKGLFELASGGTLFLDEVGDMTSTMQTKLLRVLQEGEIRRVGGEHLVKVDVRMVSASNKDIQRMVEEGTFREDLYYRLNVVRIDLPPLRDRRSDMPMLVDHFLRDDGKRQRPEKRILDDALALLMRYPFPGNIRELRNVIERAKILAESEHIELDAILLDNDWTETHGALPALSPGAAGLVPPRRGLTPPEPARQREVTARAFASPTARAAGPVNLPAGSRLESHFFQLNDRQRRLVEYLQTYGSIKNREYYEVMGVSKSTGWRDLKDLIAKEIIQVTGRGKGSVYSLDPRSAEPVDPTPQT